MCGIEKREEGGETSKYYTIQIAMKFQDAKHHHHEAL